MANLVSKENICVIIRKYNDKQTGEEKAVWKTIGELITFDNGKIIELYHMPGVKCSVFTQKQRQQTQQAPPTNQPAQQPQQPQQTGVPPPTEEINIEEIPF